MLAAACKDDPPPQSDDTGTSTGGTSSGTEPGATSSVTTLPPTTTVDPDDTTFGPGCGPDPCPEICGEDCPSTGTTGDVPCDALDAELDAWVEPSKLPAVDCGSADPDDDAFAWQTVHDCSTIQASNSQGLRATWTPGDGADPIQYGVGGRVGEVYELAWFERSGTALVQYSCTALTSTPDCTVDVGSVCLTCEGQTEVAALCGEGGGTSEGGTGGSGSSTG